MPLPITLPDSVLTAIQQLPGQELLIITFSPSRMEMPMVTVPSVMSPQPKRGHVPSATVMQKWRINTMKKGFPIYPTACNVTPPDEKVVETEEMIDLFLSLFTSPAYPPILRTHEQRWDQNVYQTARVYIRRFFPLSRLPHDRDVLN